jgi:hypothetical protein
MCSTFRRTPNNKRRKCAQITFYKAMAVCILTYGSEIWTIRKQEAEIENLGMTVFRSAAGYARKDQINIEISRELNIRDRNNKIIKSRSHWKYYDLRIPKKIVTYEYNPVRRRNVGAHSCDGGTNKLFKRMEQAKHGLIHEDCDDDYKPGMQSMLHIEYNVSLRINQRGSLIMAVVRHLCPVVSK